MDKAERIRLAYDNFKKGYNCCQSVVLAFEDILGLDREKLLAVSVGFGGGFGRTRNVCGAVSAFAIVLGLYCPHDADPHKDKANIYRQIQELVKLFQERNGSENCAQLLKNVKNLTSDYEPQIRDDEYYKVRPCVKFVTDSVDILTDYLKIGEID